MHLISISSSYSSQHDAYVLHETPLENNEKNTNNSDEQSNSFSIYIDDEIQSTEDGQSYVSEAIQPDLIIEDEKKPKDINIFNLSVEPSTHEIASALIILKNRHSLSNRCLDHICQLMRLVKASNVPKGSAHIKRILLSDSTIHFTSPSYYCSTCNQLSSKETNCSNINCEENKSFTKRPPVFLRMPLKPQIEDILLRFPSLHLQQQRCSTLVNSSDISQGNFYKKVNKNEEENNFITLTMNVDGASIAKSSRSSLWVVTFVINEFKKSERFQVQNVLVGGISAGKSKPTRKEMSVYLQSIVNELLTLENEHGFEDYDGNIKFLKVFLVAGCMDKPAQALVQNIGDPNGAYGCGKCLLRGITVPTKSGSRSKIRVFPIRRNDEAPKRRTNFTYDVKMAMPERFRPKEKEALRDFMHGYLGECHLRNLRYFDVGQSFAFDTLHNLYRGTFVRTLTAAVHATRRHALEVQTNLKLLRLSAVHVNQKTFNIRLGHLIKKIQPNIQINQSYSLHQSPQFKKVINNINEIENIRSVLGNTAKLYKTIVQEGRRFTTVKCQTSGSRNDSCIMYKVAKKFRVGFITSIIQTSSNENSCILQVRDVPINGYLTINTNGTK
ncbi:unnamed protein product [Rotaria sp. Silwood1]|nr:unnamed protein product [Rotaria sp. Silwood1]CAF4862150.1 unnamed protein product [Rotaria sp. Silwood1]CAF4929225.1 unnamed protein product [Rotaria sp. Silwood1]